MSQEHDQTPLTYSQLLCKIKAHLYTIRRSRKGSIGSPNNVYLPQLNRKRVDELTALVEERLAALPPARHDAG